MERNRCVEAGCSSACCRDAFFQNTYSENEILRVFPEAKRVNHKKIRFGLVPGIYYTKYLFGACRVRIVGVCPMLNGNECKIYENRLVDCENLSIASDACCDFRREIERETTSI
jgi:hypothetical protein